ncbi:AfsA-related hotdog domain-containing protein [Gryllotalpicola ginsengisoli]|uniref:AfsA-related hotdog domain-containing protein n=1 Tax=Gryllotalpicola ginsengisoli TaxID=444608 RepID=UPI0003B37AC5|nr:AfsA-related hotdog domain-containing protein [Gryllotalpicola ginsengisoli]
METLTHRATAVDRSAVHRSTQADVLVRTVEQLGDTTWNAHISLPRSHWLNHPRPGRVPLTLMAETLRQAGMAVCTAGLGFDASVHFVISSMSLQTVPDLLVFPRFGALEAVLEVEFREVTLRRGVPHRLEVDYLLPGAGSGHVSAQVLADRDYRAIRRNAAALADHLPQTAEDLLPGLRRRGATVTAGVGVDEADPFFFDHAVDHLPGMLLLHSAVELHERTVGRRPADVSISFPAFGELGAATQLRAEVRGAVVASAFTQGGRLVAEATTRG